MDVLPHIDAPVRDRISGSRDPLVLLDPVLAPGNRDQRIVERDVDVDIQRIEIDRNGLVEPHVRRGDRARTSRPMREKIAMLSEFSHRHGSLSGRSDPRRTST